MKLYILGLSALFVLVGTGCHTETVQETRRTYGADGTLAHSSDTENGKVISELTRVLEGRAFSGKGSYQADIESEARLTALNLAINDLALKVGAAIGSSDLTYYKGEAVNIVRTQARNIIRGYDIRYENWDKASKTYTVEIEMTTYKVAEEISRRIVNR